MLTEVKAYRDQLRQQRANAGDEDDWDDEDWDDDEDDGHVIYVRD